MQSPASSGARVISIASGKGGVGKTSISVNLAAALSARGVRVILVDGDFGLANADLLCGVRVGAHLGHVIDGTRSIDEALVTTNAGFRLAPGASGLATLLQAPASQRIQVVDQLKAIENSCDVILIDCGAGMGQGVRAFLAAADFALIVTTPEPTSIADAYALIKSMAVTATGCGLTTPSPRLLVNMCQDERDARGAHQRIADVAQRFIGLDVRMAGWLPRDSAVASAVRARSPFYVRAPHCDASKAVGRLATGLDRELRLHPVQASHGGGFWRRFFGLSRSNRRGIVNSE